MNVYVLIPPERIDRLTIFPGAPGIMCKNTRTLMFDLAKLPDIILPQDRTEMTTVLDGPNNAILDQVYSLACQTQFTCHATLHEKHFPLSLLRDLADQISYRQVCTHDEVSSIRRFYGGEGGYLVNGEDLPTSPAIHHNQENILDLEHQPQPQSRLPQIEERSPLQPRLLPIEKSGPPCKHAWVTVISIY